MRVILLALAIASATIPTADAGQSCSWIGNFWVCNGDGGHQSCSWIGNFWVCN